MQYRKFKDGNEVSLLGMGTMRLPCKEDGSVDRPAAIEMIRASIDEHGVNYVDTAYMYHGGESERVVGEALADGYREKVFLADKLPVWHIRSEEQVREVFFEQLSKLQTEYIDYYLMHNITRQIWKIAEKHNMMKFVEQMKAEGRIKHIGFSYHDDLEFFKEMVDCYPWDFCQIQLNYMDKNYQAGVEGLKYAAQKGLSVVIMEPLKGGRLTDNVPPQVEQIWAQFPIKRTPAEWAFKWVADFEEVSCILSGMSSYEQMRQNAEIIGNALPNSLTDEERRLINLASDEYNRLIKYSCTGCAYCIPCAKKIDIPEVISLYNEQFIYGDTPASRLSYSFLAPGRRAGDCIACGLCEGKCPQHLPISEIMKNAAEVFGE